MFWARSELVKCLSKLQIEQLFDRDKDGQLDGSISHAIERLFGVIAISNSKKFWAFKDRL
jgi:lipopolysaccharide biosynthesis protein